MIKQGSEVSVDFNNSMFTLCKRAKVLYTPATTGDGWVFEDLDTGDIHNVSEPCTITLKKK